MASKKRKKYTSKYYIPGTDSQRGRALDQFQQEMIVQAYAMTGNKSEVARRMKLSYPTVNRILKKAETDPVLLKARADVMSHLGGKVYKKTEEILDSIGAQDIESGHIKKYDEEGNLESVRSYGPSLMQKVTSAAILSDKLRVLHDTKRAILDDGGAQPGALPLPGNVQDALKLIGEKVKRLRVIDVQLHDKVPDLATKVQDIAVRASNISDADFEELDFDNPGG